jgi:hypothetical protein
VWTHPWVIGKLTCGNLPDPGRVLDLFQELPAETVATAMPT